MTTTKSSMKPTGGIHAEMELTINAPRQKVWDAFLNDAHIWWHKDFYTSKTPAKFVIDSKIGGHMYEDAGNGTGLIWFNILGINPPEMLFAIGYTAPPFGGPAAGLLTFSLEEIDENTTRFKVSDATFGVVTENMAESASSGWTMLFTELKTHVEK